MPEPFDAYHKWLGIAPKDQPPHHYRLLGIDLFETDGDVIASAADQRMAHVRSFQAGQHSALSQKLLNQIAAARVCLLDPKKKAAYDRQLKTQLSPPNVPPPAVETPAGKTPAVTTPMFKSLGMKPPAVQTPAAKTPALQTPAVQASPVPPPPTAADDVELGFLPLADEGQPSRGRSTAKARPSGDPIGNDVLTVAHLPPPRSPWRRICVFAVSYLGYDHWGSHAECVDVANTTSDMYEKLGELPNSLDELRTCLFVEYQRYLDYGWTPDEKRLKYLHAIIEKIRRQVSRD